MIIKIWNTIEEEKQFDILPRITISWAFNKFAVKFVWLFIKIGFIF